MNTNPQDPILNTLPDRERELFKRFSAVADGFPAEVAIGAAMNIVINAIRQATPDWTAAERAYDEYFGKCKQLLKDHYDTLGRKRGIFPYDQVLVVNNVHNDPENYRKF